MNLLTPFGGSSIAGLQVAARIQATQVGFEFVFQVDDPDQLVKWPGVFGSGAPGMVQMFGSPGRENDLWRSTCFEVFLSPAGSKEYFEFNFSTLGSWNCYHFEEYRRPQPPRPSSKFLASALCWNPSTQSLSGEVTNKTKFTDFVVGITTVVETLAGEKKYFALHHGGQQPDFHLADSFLLSRSLGHVV